MTGYLKRAAVPVVALGLAMTCLTGVTGCGGALGGESSNSALTARLDQMEATAAEQRKHLKEMSARITELENLVLMQKNEIDDLQAAVATKPKTLVAVVEKEDEGFTVPVEGSDEATTTVTAPAAVWDDEVPWEYEGAAEDSGDEEERPLLTLYGTPPAPEQPGTGSPPPGSLQPAAMLTDPSTLGPFVPLKLPSLTSDGPAVGEALEGGATGAGFEVDPYAQGVEKYQAGEWSSAVLYFDIYLKHEPQGSKVMNALFLKAESLYQMNKYVAAIGQFELVLDRFPGGSRSLDAKLRIGRCYEKLGDKSKAESIYKDIVLNHSGTKHATKAGKLLQALK